MTDYKYKYRFSFIINGNIEYIDVLLDKPNSKLAKEIAKEQAYERTNTSNISQ